MKKIMLLTILLLCCCVVLADAQPKKIALVGRISWCPDSDNASSGNRDFDVMQHFSMDDELLRFKCATWGFFAPLMPDYVVQFMMMEGDEENRGYAAYINPGIYMIDQFYEDYNFFIDNEYDLVYNTGTCWSSIAPPLKEVGVPVIQGEHACLGERAKLGSLGMFYGERSDDHSGSDTLILTDEGKTHPLTAGMGDEIVIFGDGPDGPPEDPGSAWAGIDNHIDDCAPGTIPLAVWSDDPDKVAIAVVEEGGELADGSAAMQRMSMMFWTGQVRPSNEGEIPPVWLNVIEHLTADGEELMLRTILWTMGEDPSAVENWQMN